jgi:hypothetical protein
MAAFTINFYRNAAPARVINKRRPKDLPLCHAVSRSWERKWPPIMTIGRVFHLGPVECGPWFTIVKPKPVHEGPGGMIGGGGRGGVGGGGGRGEVGKGVFSDDSKGAWI